MYVPTEGEYIKEDVTLDDAIHLLVLGDYQSLLVTKDDKITAIAHRLYNPVTMQ